MRRGVLLEHAALQFPELDSWIVGHLISLQTETSYF